MGTPRVIEADCLIALNWEIVLEVVDWNFLCSVVCSTGRCRVLYGWIDKAIVRLDAFVIGLLSMLRCDLSISLIHSDEENKKLRRDLCLKRPKLRSFQINLLSPAPIDNSPTQTLCGSKC